MLSFFHANHRQICPVYLVCVVMTFFQSTVSANTLTDTTKGERRIYNTIRVQGTKPVIDGVLNDSCWSQGTWGRDYRQQLPSEGAAPTQKTELKILYDDENIYVAIRAYDNQPQLIDRQMGRRDEFQGDIVGVNFDSYFDHRTGFEFNLTAAGSKVDLILTNNGWDTNWNPVWDGKVSHQDSSWTAEMKVPLSQLRYSSNPVQVWGLHSWRWNNRNQEEDQWNLIPRDNVGPLYYFGELHGLSNLPRVKRIEFMPYTVGKITTYPMEEGNPFSDGSDPSLTFGLDGKFGAGSNFTVDYTLNPDFGQVEADPSELNLTAFETYFEEKRPFFVEGQNIFDFSFDDNQLFYSRRIGHAPIYDPALSEGEYIEKPDNTSILGAMKLTGKSEKGLSVGIVESLTAREYGRISSPGEDYNVIVEPLTNYFVGRVQQDINKSNTMIGGMFTSTNRDLSEDYLKHMNKSAFTGGVDFKHYLKNKTFVIDFKSIFSQVNGSPEAMTSLQQESSRYYQRPDAPHLSLDTTLNSMAGFGGSFEFLKQSNGNWRYGIGSHWRSPGLELNDAGFQNMADEFMEGAVLEYVENEPRGIFRSYDLGLTNLNFWNFGGEFIRSELIFEAGMQFKNKWRLDGNIERTGKTMSAHLLRGGPGVYTHGTTEQFWSIETDGSKKLAFEFDYGYNVADGKVSTSHIFNPEIVWKIATSLQLTTDFLFTKSMSGFQYIENEEMEQNGYLLGQLDRKTYMITLRLNYAITPEFTIQYYGSPYITTGHYSHFKTLDDTESPNPNEVFRTFDDNEIPYNSDDNVYDLYNPGQSEPYVTFENPDFNFRQFRSNLVARWEYRPGSVVYLVWTHDRTSSEDITNDNFEYNMNGLFNEEAVNVFLLKFSYWFSM